MGLAEEQETRVRRDSERVLPQPEVAHELTLNRVFRGVAPQWAPIRQISLQVDRHRPKSRNGSGFQRIRDIMKTWDGRNAKELAVKEHRLGTYRPKRRGCRSRKAILTAG